MHIEETYQYTLQYSIYKKTSKINYLGVKRRFQRNGIGRVVVFDFIEKCKSLGINQIKIDAYTGSIKFWEKMGFTVSKVPQVIDGYKQDYHDGILKL